MRNSTVWVIAGTLRGVAEENIPELVRVRLGKRERLLESGTEPYPVDFGRTGTAAELRVQEQIAHSHPQASNDATSANESSTSEHLASLRDGGRTVLHHPWGFGLGNSGVTAARTHVTVKAGESTYTELGVETGVLGMFVFIAWSLALLRSTLRRRVWVGAAFAAVLLLGLQTDVIGVPWIAVTVWAFAGDSA